MQNGAQTKLAKCETSIRRWQTRLVRATNMLTKLERQRRRLQAKMGPVNLTDLIGPAKETPAPKEKGALASIPTGEVIAMVTEAIDHPPVNADDDAFKIPPELNRADPLIAERMTAARKKAEAEARKAMPLTGKAARDYIKAPLKKRKA